MMRDPLVQNLLNEVIKEEENFCVVQCLIDGTNKDEEIAEKTEVKLNIVRKVLYKLYDAGLASYKRNKDPETQWYTYTWKFHTDNVTDQIESKAEDMINNLRKLLEFEENNMFFVCEDGHARFDFDESASRGFICPECGNEIVFEDNSKIITHIQQEITSYEETYDFVRSANAK